MDLHVDGKVVKSWSVATAPDNYTYDGYRGGEVQVVFQDDGGSRQDGTDRNLAINYLIVCGTKYENNTKGVTRTGCGTDNQRGFAWLWCNGSLNFGNVGCNGNARSTTLANKEQSASTESLSFQSYPNPASGQLTVQGGQDYRATLYDISGRAVMRHEHLKHRAQLDIRYLRPGVYLLKMNDAQQQLQERIVVR